MAPNGNNLVSPDEMKAGTLRGASAEQFTPMDGREVEHNSRPLKPSELQKHLDFGPNATDNTPLVPGREPPRNALTDPPPGYRMPLASAPVDGSEPLPSEADEDKPWYERMWRTTKNH